MSTITFSRVRKAYGGVQAVDGLDLELPAGRSVALLGPNGAGKSTSIDMLLGLVAPDSGDIDVFGLSPAEAVARGQVGAMLQDGALPEGLTVAETVSFVRRLYPDPLPLDEVMELADLTSLARRRVSRLSGVTGVRVEGASAVLRTADSDATAEALYLRLEILRSLRDGRFLFFTLAFPIGLFLLFSNVFAGPGETESGTGLDVGRYMMVAFGSYGAIGAALNATGLRLAAELDGGWLRQLRVTPLAAWTAVLGALAVLGYRRATVAA